MNHLRMCRFNLQWSTWGVGLRTNERLFDSKNSWTSRKWTPPYSGQLQKVQWVSTVERFNFTWEIDLAMPVRTSNSLRMIRLYQSSYRRSFLRRRSSLTSERRKYSIYLGRLILRKPFISFFLAEGKEPDTEASIERSLLYKAHLSHSLGMQPKNFIHIDILVHLVPGSGYSFLNRSKTHRERYTSRCTSSRGARIHVRNSM